VGGGHTAVAKQKIHNTELTKLENSRKDLDDLGYDPARTGADKGKIME
jgi:hypothetical protein